MKKIIKFNPNKPYLSDRDIFILSKGHAAAALYAVLAKGYFSKRKLLEYGSDNSNIYHKVPGVESFSSICGYLILYLCNIINQ